MKDMMQNTMNEREKLEQTIAALEAQRSVVGDMVVDTALAPLREKLVALVRVEHPAIDTLEGERKLVTVMFADLSDFTSLSEKMDPEHVRGIMNTCFDRLVPLIERYEGTVDKFIGDEIMALFGAPVAHENDPERALRAARDMMAEIKLFNREYEMNFDLHIGINTGLVIAGGIGSIGRQHYSVIGDTVNVAARLQDLSERGKIVVGPDTYRLTASIFEFESIGPTPVEGKSDPISIYRLIGFRGHTSVTEASTACSHLSLDAQ